MSDWILIPELVAKNGKDIEVIVQTIGLGNLLKLAPHFIAIAETFSALQKGK